MLLRVSGGTEGEESVVFPHPFLLCDIKPQAPTATHLAPGLTSSAQRLCFYRAGAPKHLEQEKEPGKEAVVQAAGLHQANVEQGRGWHNSVTVLNREWAKWGEIHNSQNS